MAGRPLLDLDGFHNIVNRGVARSNIYKGDGDKQKFLEIRSFNPNYAMTFVSLVISIAYFGFNN